MHDYIKQVLEAALFAADGPLSREALLALFDADELDGKALNAQLKRLQDDYAERGIELREVASGFRFQVRRKWGPWVSRLWQEKPPRYSRALLETLALIAYRQPLTRGEIEDVRGVSVSTQIIKTLLERDWIRRVGHRDVPGRPVLYATTRGFLDYFGLASLDALPSLAAIRELDDIDRELTAKTAPANASTEESAPAAGDMPEDSVEPPIDAATSAEAQAELVRVDAILEGFNTNYTMSADQPQPSTKVAVESTTTPTADNNSTTSIEEKTQ